MRSKLQPIRKRFVIDENSEVATHNLRNNYSVNCLTMQLLTFDTKGGNLSVLCKFC